MGAENDIDADFLKTCFAGLELLTLRGSLWQGEVFDNRQEWPVWLIPDADVWLLCGPEGC